MSSVGKEIQLSPLLIVGMHRSGTSLIASICGEAGYSMGEDLMGRDPSNVSGHFEDKKFVALNDKLLEMAGGNWSCPPQPDLCDEAFARLEVEYREYVAARNDVGAWGVKDPRLSLFLHSFSDLLDRPKIIVCERSESDVAESLMKRDSMNREEAIKIKKEYDSRIKKSIQRMGVKDVFYADYNALRSNKTLIEDLLEFLNLSCSDQGNIYEKVLSPDELKVEKRKEAKRKLMIAIKKAVLSPSKFFRWRSYNELHRLIGYWWNG